MSDGISLDEQEARVRHLVATGQVTLREDTENLPDYLKAPPAGVPRDWRDEGLVEP